MLSGWSSWDLAEGFFEGKPVDLRYSTCTLEQGSGHVAKRVLPDNGGFDLHRDSEATRKHLLSSSGLKNFLCQGVQLKQRA